MVEIKNRSSSPNLVIYDQVEIDSGQPTHVSDLPSGKPEMGHGIHLFLVENTSSNEGAIINKQM